MHQGNLDLTASIGPLIAKLRSVLLESLPPRRFLVTRMQSTQSLLGFRQISDEVAATSAAMRTRLGPGRKTASAQRGKLDDNGKREVGVKRRDEEDGNSRVV